MKTPYQTIIPWPDLSVMALEMAAQRLAPRHVYDLTVGDRLMTTARLVLKDIGAETRGNPLSPYVNLRVDPEFAPLEWCLGDGETAWGSPGV